VEAVPHVRRPDVAEVGVRLERKVKARRRLHAIDHVVQVLVNRRVGAGGELGRRVARAV
jgi:hypothetical protein